jgi:WD40 repeat protein
MKEKWLNRIALVGFILIMGLWAWWLFRPQPMPFVLRARWKVQGFEIGGIAFSPKGDWLAALVSDFQQGQSTVQLWQVPKTQNNPKVFPVSQQVQPMVIVVPQLDFSPDGRLLAVGYLEQGVGKVDLFKVALFTVPEGRRLQTITMGKWVLTPTVTFSPDGRLAVVFNFRLWFVRIDDGKKTPTNIRAESIVFSPDGQWMVAAQGQSMSIYDANGHLVKEIQLQPTSHTIVFSLLTATFSKDGQRLACLWLESQQRRLPIAPVRRYGVSVWQTDGWRLMWSTPLTPFYEIFFFPYATFAPDLSMVALAEPDPSGWDGTLWRLERFVWRLLGHHIPFAPPTQVVVRRLSDGQIVAKLPRLRRNVGDCAFSPDGRYLAVAHGTSLPFGSARAIELSIGIRSRSAMLSSAFKFAPASFRLHFPTSNEIGFEASQKLGRMRRR